MHIAHIYNNTDWPILVLRGSAGEELSRYNFKKIIPPYSVIPFAMVWLPRITKEQSLKPSIFSSVRLLVLKKSKAPLPPSFSPVTELQGIAFDQPITQSDIDSIVNGIVNNMQQTPLGLSGINPAISELKRNRFLETFALGDTFFKLYSVVGNNPLIDPQTVVIKSCDRFDLTEKTLQQITDPSFKGIQPPLLRLIINEAPAGDKDLIKLRIDPISDEAVYRSEGLGSSLTK